jgi:hypothetical protein
MNKYYTTIETIQDGQQFIGVVYETSTNQQIFKTNSHPSHIQAVNEINNFLKTKLSNNIPAPGTSIEISNSIRPVTIKGIVPGTGGRRCCGR